jgi:hypothetical protein
MVNRTLVRWAAVALVCGAGWGTSIWGGEQAVESRLAIGASRLGWPGIGKAWDAISGEAIPVGANEVVLPLDSWQYRVLRVQGKKAPKSE